MTVRCFTFVGAAIIVGAFAAALGAVGYLAAVEYQYKAGR